MPPAAWGGALRNHGVAGRARCRCHQCHLFGFLSKLAAQVRAAAPPAARRAATLLEDYENAGGMLGRSRAATLLALLPFFFSFRETSLLTMLFRLLLGPPSPRVCRRPALWCGPPSPRRRRWCAGVPRDAGGRLVPSAAPFPPPFLFDRALSTPPPLLSNVALFLCLSLLIPSPQVVVVKELRDTLDVGGNVNMRVARVLSGGPPGLETCWCV